MLNYRKSVILRGTGANALFASGYFVTVYPVGAEVTSGSSGTTLNVRAGHSFRTNDKLIVGTDTTQFRTVSGVTATTLTVAAVTVVAGDLLTNLGPDTGSSTPNFDASPVKIYSDPAGAGSAVTNSTVTCDSQGEFEYYHKGDGRMWELIRSASTTVAEVRTGFGGVMGRLNVQDYGAVGDGSTNVGPRLAAAALVGKPLFVPEDASYYLTGAVIELTNSIRGGGKPQIRFTGGSAATDAILLPILNVEDFTGELLEICNLHLKGDWDEAGTATEFAHNIRLKGALNVYIHHCAMETPYGDNVQIEKSASRNCNNIIIDSCTLSTPRRCNLAVLQGESITIRNCEMQKGNDYVAAIDLETEDSGNLISDVIISNNRFDCLSAYFVSTSGVAGSTIRRIHVEGNIGQADYFFRNSITSAIDTTDISLVNNTLYGAATNGRFGLFNTASRVQVIGNKMLCSAGTNTFSATTVDDFVFANNYFATTTKVVGPTFDECNRVQCIGNFIGGISSTNGSLVFQTTGGAATTGHVIANNIITGSNYGIVVKDNEITDTVLSGNYIDASGRCISIDVAASTSDIFAWGNTYAGAGVPLANPTYLLRVHDQRFTQAAGNPPQWTNDAAPTAGAHQQGDLSFEIAAAAGQNAGYICITGGTPGTWKQFGIIDSQEALVWNPGSLADGAGETSSAIAVAAGCSFGDYVLVGAPYDLQGITCTGYVSSSGNVQIRLQNETTGTIDLASGTWRVKVIRASS